PGPSASWNLSREIVNKPTHGGTSLPERVLERDCGSEEVRLVAASFQLAGSADWKSAATVLTPAPTGSLELTFPAGRTPPEASARSLAPRYREGKSAPSDLSRAAGKAGRASPQATATMRKS